MGRCTRESEPDARRRAHGEAKLQTRAREHRDGLIEKLAEGLRSARASGFSDMARVPTQQFRTTACFENRLSRQELCSAIRSSRRSPWSPTF